MRARLLQVAKYWQNRFLPLNRTNSNNKLAQQWQKVASSSSLLEVRGTTTFNSQVELVLTHTADQVMINTNFKLLLLPKCSNHQPTSSI